MTKETRTDIEIYSAIAMLVAGVSLATAGFIVPPTGEITQKGRFRCALKEFHCFHIYYEL